MRDHHGGVVNVVLAQKPRLELAEQPEAVLVPRTPQERGELATAHDAAALARAHRAQHLRLAVVERRVLAREGPIDAANPSGPVFTAVPLSNTAKGWGAYGTSEPYVLTSTDTRLNDLPSLRSREL